MSVSIAEDDVDYALIRAWTKLDRSLPAPFANLESTICFVPELMRTSRMDEKIAALDAKISARTKHNKIPARTKHNFPKRAAILVQRAFGLGSATEAKKHVGADSGGLAHGNFFEGCLRVHDALKAWQKPLLEQAIIELMTISDADGLQIMCGILLRAANECEARKHFAFMVAIDRSIILAADNADTDLDTDLARSKKRLMDAAHNFVDELKTKAFRSTFTEPTKLYFRAVKNTGLEGDVEVHGSNTYLAVLLVTLGIKLTQTPLLDDTHGAVAPFYECLSKGDLDRLWATENVGKSWELVLGRDYCPTLSFVPTDHNQSFFPGHNPREVALELECCLQNSSSGVVGVDQHQLRLLPYLSAFVSHFSADVAVEKLCNDWFNDRNVHPALDAVYRAVTGDDNLKNMATCWLWDMDTGMFHLDRAKLLLRAVGIIVDKRNRKRSREN